MKSEVFKIQRPMAGSDNMLLIYNQSRSIFTQHPMTQEISKLMGDSYKIYVKGYIDDESMLVIEELVGYKPW